MIHLSQEGSCLGGSKDYTRQDDDQIEIKSQEAREEKKRCIQTRENDDQTEELNLTNRADTEVIVDYKGSGEKGGSTVDQVSTARPEVSVATPCTPPTTTTIFGDEDLTISQTLIKMKSEKAKEKGVDFRDVEEPPRLTRSTTTLQPLPTIDLKDKGKGVLVKEEPEKLQKVKKKGSMMLYERDKKWIDDFVPMDSEKEEKKLVEPESKDKKGKRIKRVADSEPKQKSSKKQKMMQEQESAKSDEEESADYKQENEELRMQDLVDLHILVMKRFEDNTPEEKRYPLIKEMLEKMLNWKLEAEAESTMAFELLKFIKSRIEE
nr:hypothetical protein [Tanacetum cinerariifolium]